MLKEDGEAVEVERPVKRQAQEEEKISVMRVSS